MTDFIHLTTHSKERAIRRYALDSENLKRMAQLAVMEGYSINDAPNKRVKRYLKRKQRRDTLLYVHGGYVFILSKQFVLITTFRLPRKYFYAK